MNNLIVSDAAMFVTDAQSHSLSIRMLGSCAVIWISEVNPEHRPRPVKDIDLVATVKQRMEVQRWLKSKGWMIDASLLLLSENRETFISEAEKYTVDVYYDFVDGNHKIPLSGQLARSFPTIPWDDLILTKLQRRILRDVDVWDLVALLNIRKIPDLTHFVSLVGSDWGLWTTVTDNLSFLKLTVGNLNSAAMMVLLDTLNKCKKSLRWRVRSIIGRRMKWWREVYDVKTIVEETIIANR